MSHKVLKAKEKQFGKPPDNCVFCRFHRRTIRKGYTGWNCAKSQRDLAQSGIFHRPRWCGLVAEPGKEEKEKEEL